MGKHRFEHCPWLVFPIHQQKIRPFFDRSFKRNEHIRLKSLLRTKFYPSLVEEFWFWFFFYLKFCLQVPRSSSELNVSQSIPSLMNRIPQNYSQLAQKTRQFSSAVQAFDIFCLRLEIKEKVKLQQIPGGTIWPHAKIDSIHSLSKFHIQNFNQNVRDSFDQMLVQLKWEETTNEKHFQERVLRSVSFDLTVLSKLGQGQFHLSSWNWNWSTSSSSLELELLTNSVHLELLFSYSILV